jgi:hypothetical protein
VAGEGRREEEEQGYIVPYEIMYPVDGPKVMRDVGNGKFSTTQRIIMANLKIGE